ncbi:MrcB family domain-containing protein [Sutcliffiella cohnii]
MLENLILELLKGIKIVYTLKSNKPNWITNLDDKGVYIETDASRKKYNNNEASRPYAFIPFEFILKAWSEFLTARTASADDFVETRGRSSFLMALFSQLPFVEVIKENGIRIRLKEFQTDDLPSEQFHKVIGFLEDVINDVYDPVRLSEQVQGNEYRVKTRGRQDLRLLGFLNESHEKNRLFFERYEEAKDKNKFIKDLVLQREYFQIAIYVLDLLRNFPKQEKKLALVELGKLIVRNSRGDNLMVDSVANERTHNLLMWLESLNVIDQEWRPIEEARDLSREDIKVVTSLREHFQYIMNNYLQAKTQPFGGHQLGTYVRHDVTAEIKKLPFITEDYVVTGSVGQGNWAGVPWIAIMNRGVTVSTQRGYYIVYLFSEDMKELYLTLAQGVTETTKEEMEQINEDIRNNIEMNPRFQKDGNINLGPSKRARDYAASTAVYVRYLIDNMPSEEQLVKDLEEMVFYYEMYIQYKKGKKTEYELPAEETAVGIAEELETYVSRKDLVDHIHNYIRNEGFYYEREELINLFLSLKSKPFVIISGISGTGKTKVIQWFAESVGATEHNGQFALIPVRPDWSDGSDLIGYKNINEVFIDGPLTKVLRKAIRNPDKPYFVLLDEMNLARVEYYFSDLLSVMESRKWEDGVLVSSSILSEDVAGEEIWFPENLYIIGTVNMDETTHPFSKKVLDRANTIEFNRVRLDYLDFLTGTLDKSEIRHIANRIFRADYLFVKDVFHKFPKLVEETSMELVSINNALIPLGAQVGYRVRDEICMYLAYNEESDLLLRDEAFDNCILQKILPRISGSDTRVERTLKELFKLFTNRELDDNAFLPEKQEMKYPKSAEKVFEMYRRLSDDSFTSFWIS